MEEQKSEVDGGKGRASGRGKIELIIADKLLGVRKEWESWR